MRKLLTFAAVAALLTLLYSCASIGNPSGGPRDEDPPRFVRANPAPGATNVKTTKVAVEFDELVNVKDAFSKVVVSPYMKTMPKVSSSGRRVIVDFGDSLMANTTYSIDFADAIEDNNEGNKLKNFTYSFSSGETIDTLIMSGIVLSARELEPQKGVLVGVYEDLSDTVFMHRPPTRIARTDDRGRFSIRGLRQVPYRIYALDDKDADYRYANPEEDIAFERTMFLPSSMREETFDTIWNIKTGAVDTVVSRQRTVFTPNTVLLRTFNVNLKPQYVVNYERRDSTVLHYIFNSPQTSLPQLALGIADDATAEEDAVILPGDSVRRRLLREGRDYTLQRSATNDTLTYWLRNPELILSDTLDIATGYNRLDSAYNPVGYVDLLQFVHNRPKPLSEKELEKQRKKAEREGKKQRNIQLPGSNVQDSIARITLSMKSLSSGSLDVNQPFVMEFATPLERIDTSAFRLSVKRDTVFVPLTGWKLSPADTLGNPRYKIEYPWEYEGEYKVEADTIAAIGIYGKPTRPFSQEFKIKGEDEYCELTFNIVGLEPGEHAFVELLNSSDAVVRSAVVENNEAYFPFLAPGKYYARLIEDFNGNGRYDTGNFVKQQMPEVSYYYPKVVNLKKNWDKSETWNLWETAVDLQKPDAVKKNKPETTRLGKEKKLENDDDGEDDFDSTRNPFDPNDKGRKGVRL